MKFIVNPSSLTGGTVTVPGDKSISHRAVMFNAIAKGSATVSGFLAGEDCLCTIQALRDMGVSIEQPEPTVVRIHGKGLHGLSRPDAPLYMGNSGTAMRLFAGLLSGQTFQTELTGDASLSGRPMNRIIEPLSSMGADLGSNGGKPPLRIPGASRISGITYEMPVASAQVKSAIMLAGLYSTDETVLIEPDVSRDHTERMFEAMGLDVTRGDLQVSMRGGQQPQALDLAVPADLSSAAFPLVATLLSDDSELTIENVGINPTRTGVLQILSAMGADLDISNERMMGAEPVADITARSSNLQGIDVDPALVSLAIDEFPLLFVAAAAASGITRFSGIAELRVKESDRIGAMAQGLLALGGRVEEFPDGAVVHGGPLRGGSARSHGDHRIAMAFSVAAAKALEQTVIEDTEAVNTSFPGFVDCMKSVGLDISTVDEGDQ